MHDQGPRRVVAPAIGVPVLLAAPVRRDRLGRRIGRNRWRDYITDHWRCADHAWWLEAEAASNGWKTELAEFRASKPRPNLGDFMVALAPSWCRP